MRASRWLCRRCASGGNWYYGDAVYGPLYYGFGGAGEVGDRQVMARSYDEMFAQLDLKRNIMAHEKGKQQFEEVVFKKELAEISHRRKAANSQQPDVETNLSPSAEHGLVGLALSGGGIRSATLCLGALQALAKQRGPEVSRLSLNGFRGWIHRLLPEFGHEQDRRRTAG